MPTVLRLPLTLVHRPAFWFVRNCCGIELPHTARVGRRFLIGHQSGIVIHHNAVIGDDCLVRQNVTIGAGTASNADRAPRLGNGVEIGAGAAIIGPVTIGDHVRIGPNAVVTMNVPAGSIVVAPPPRVIVPPGPKPKNRD
jgi:serine O-acetyltransferase